LGQFQYAANYQKALERQAKWQHALGQVFEKVDFIALPNSSGSCRQKFHSSAAGPFLTALAIPIPSQDKTVHVTSLQLVGPRLSEAALLNAGRLNRGKAFTA
jgi:Asp-tRNA(Asn)/Glu-tRNA(Gln) amidotransferase A subunit family amidase